MALMKPTGMVEALIAAENTFTNEIDIPAGMLFEVNVIPQDVLGSGKVTLYKKVAESALLPAPGWVPIRVYEAADLQLSTTDTYGGVMETFIAGQAGTYRIGAETGDFNVNVYCRIATK